MTKQSVIDLVSIRVEAEREIRQFFELCSAINLTMQTYPTLHPQVAVEMVCREYDVPFGQFHKLKKEHLRYLTDNLSHVKKK